MTARMLVMAKAPHPGRVKTRLAADIGDEIAADLAAAALLDTVAACTDAGGPSRCHLALAGDLTGASRGVEIAAALDGWTITPQTGNGLGERLARAHADVPGPRVQVGMDTPQVTADDLRAVAAGLEAHEAVLAPAYDGGWWALALRDPDAATALATVPMSQPDTGDLTGRALERIGLTVASADVLRDVDTVDDAEAVAALAPGSRFGRAWRAVGVR